MCVCRSCRSQEFRIYGMKQADLWLCRRLLSSHSAQPRFRRRSDSIRRGSGIPPTATLLQLLQLLQLLNFSENSEVRRVRVSSQIFTRASPWGAPDFSPLTSHLPHPSHQGPRYLSHQTRSVINKTCIELD